MSITLVLANACLLLGGVTMLIGALGLLRFPDFYSRTHSATMTDTAGAGFMLLGLMLLAGWQLITLKLVVILLFLLTTSPTAGHALAQAAMVDELKPLGLIEKDS